MELVPRAGFALEVGDTVRFIRPRGGLDAGYFEGWNRGGKAIVRPLGSERARHLAPEALRPGNDGRMVQQRGRLENAS